MKRIAAARPFQSLEDKGPQGFQYVYIGRSRKIIRSEVRSRLGRSGIDTGRILDVTFPASGVLGLLMHLWPKVDATLFPNFDPLDPKHLADPQYMAMSHDERCQKMHDIVNNRAIDTLSFLRPLVVGAVARSFVDLGWIDDQNAKDALANAQKKLGQNLKWNSNDLWNANGLRATTIQDVLSHVTNSDILFITEAWLTAGYFPANWSQYHLYGTLVSNGNGRESGGVSCFVSPHCPIPVTQLPSPNAYTLSIKIGSVNVHCTYFPPNLSRELVLSALRFIPLGSDTILCGDFNARLGPLIGDSITTPRGTDLATWCEQQDLLVLNTSLAHGVSTFSTFRQNTEQRSIIDLFLTNIPDWNFKHPSLVVESDLSLGSDHRLMTLSFEYDSALRSGGSRSGGDGSGGSDTIAPRRLWNLSRLGEDGPKALFQSKFVSLVAPLVDSLTDLVSNPPLVCPDIDGLNQNLNDRLYQALDSSVGVKKPNSGKKWKVFWSNEMQEAARERDRCFGRWRHSRGVDKAYWWNQHLAAHKSLRRLVSAAKRLSWKNFCESLETNLSKATATLARIKRRRQCSSTYAHLDGPQASVDAMANHLSSVYAGNLLPPPASRPPPPPRFLENSPLPVPDDGLFDVDRVLEHINRLPSRKDPGSDHLKAEMLKSLGKDIAKVLSLLFTLCYQWSYTPSLWRIANVFPINKKGDPFDPANYRPISLTSVIRKLFEFTLSGSLSLLSPPLDVAQGGLCPQRSPLDQALCLHDLIRDYLRTNHRLPVVAFLVIKAAYDTVDRRVIWNSLANSPLPKPILALLVNLFDDVHISVLISNHVSTPFSPATGVLQGSVLSPLLYSLYINSLPGVLRSVATPSTTSVLPPGATQRTPINCLLFADDVAILGSASQVQRMLNLSAEHSQSIGYRWSPSKCAVLNAPTTGPQMTLYGNSLPTVDEFVYLGVPFNKDGLYGPGILSLRKASAIKTMALLTSVGVHKNGFSLLLCSRLYTSFIRPKIEYGLAISHFTATQIKAIDDTQNRLVRMFVGGSWFKVAKHITCLPSMKHRYNVLVTRYVLRANSLPDDCLLVLLKSLQKPPRLISLLQKNALYRSLPTPLPTTHDQFVTLMAKAVTSGHHVLLRACRPCTSKPDPILYLPMSKTARSCLVRWRLGRFANMREQCPCFSGEYITRDHFLSYRALESTLWDSLPPSPSPTIHRLDFAISSLPTSASSGPPPYWSELLQLLYAIDCLVHPLANIAPDPDPGDSWLPSLLST
ncbi:hypothetical protein INT47_006506 [Mucor saturninus]|uniref:Reverse transcriptase domain-containing protein n=1 Tax=Mucor saturninus TaxID=64648 RepID=A0A8H7QGH7_9FUNG|nr:hypothetical protein INT47_006506 [Mucor saturninus]